jgi:hypothetical protein
MSRVMLARKSPMPTALGDVTILDLSHALAGPFASTMLAQCGAHVIKIEPPKAGDIARGWGPPFYGGESAYFVNLNPNKLSLALDLKHPHGKDLFFRLLVFLNAGIEVGQLVFVAGAFQLLYLASSRWQSQVRHAVSFCVMSLGMYWFVQRALLN